jgi:hypothetical protein
LDETIHNWLFRVLSFLLYTFILLSLLFSLICRKAFCFCYESKNFCHADDESNNVAIYHKNKKQLGNPFSEVIISNKTSNIVVRDSYICTKSETNENEIFDENYHNNQAADTSHIRSSINRFGNNDIKKTSRDNSANRIILEFPEEIGTNKQRNPNNYYQKRLFENTKATSATSNISYSEPDNLIGLINDKKNGKMKPKKKNITLFNEDISKSLEKTLIKMQKTFDPFKLNDENLKFAILKEILECQRLLITANLSQKRENQITINEIYDEWKILAMVVDRICFFVYLTALVVSSGLFFLSEQIYDNES